MDGSLLPSSSDLFEQAIEESFNPRWTDLGDAVAAIRTAKLVTRPPSFQPWLVYEYGLGELTPYVPNIYQLLDEGKVWQRLRGTPDAMVIGLAWIAYSATIEEAWSGRAWWNSYQLRFPALPPQDTPDLERIEGIARLSTAKRSQMRRGVYHYDAGPAECDRSLLDQCLVERESGIAITMAGTLWSFGRTTEITHLLTEAEGLSIGNWIETEESASAPWLQFPASDDGFSIGDGAEPENTSLAWATATFPWVTATFLWAASGASARAALMAAWFEARPIYVTLRDGSGIVIGHRRCRAVHAVTLQFNGAYAIDGARHQPAAGGTLVYAEALTDFGDADEVTASHVELTIGATLVDGVPPGRLWLDAGDLAGGQAVASTAISLPLRTTVRDQFKFLLRF